MSEPRTDPFRRLSGRLAFVASGVFTTVALAAALAVVVALLRADVLGLRRLELLGLMGAPAVCHLWALWSLRGLFAALARHGLVFEPSMSGAITRTGWGLLSGGGVTLAAAPLIVTNVPSHSAAGFVIASLPAVTMALVGLSLITLAALLRRGLAMQAEKAALETTLGEFV